MNPGATALTVMPRRRSARSVGVGVDEPDDPRLGGRVVALAAVAGDAGDRRHEHDVPARRAGRPCRGTPRSSAGSSARLTSSDRAPAVGVGVGEQLVAGDAGVVHHDVEPAVAGAGVVEDAATGVRRGDVGLQRGAADLVRDRGERRAGRRDVDADDGGAVAREGAGDVGADAAGRPGDDGDLAGRAGCRRRRAPARRPPRPGRPGRRRTPSAPRAGTRRCPGPRPRSRRRRARGWRWRRPAAPWRPSA